MSNNTKKMAWIVGSVVGVGAVILLANRKSITPYLSKWEEALCKLGESVQQEAKKAETQILEAEKKVEKDIGEKVDHIVDVISATFNLWQKWKKGGSHG